MGRLKRLIYGWDNSDAETYRECYSQFGGSINVHPDVLEYIGTRTGLDIKYFHREKNGLVVGGYPVVAGKHVGVKLWNKYPISYDDVLFPLSAECRAFFPERCNRISPSLTKNLLNINYSIARKGTVCLVKDCFSAKTEKNRRNEYRKFVSAGGTCIDQKKFSAAELADLYVKLFDARFAGKVRCHDKEILIDIFTYLRHLIFGNVLFINDKPCAIDLVFFAESEKIIYFDVPNGGIDPEYSHLSPGSLVMWKNINSARDFCEEKGKRMIFSIGAYEEKWAYKLRWANLNKTGKPFF